MGKASSFILRLSTTTFAIVLAACGARAQQIAELDNAVYGAYGHFPVGTTRVLGMGGAFVGLADDASAVITNPAGLSLAKFNFDYTGGENRIVNREVFFYQSTDRQGLPFTSQFRTGAARWGRFGIGFAFNRPFVLDFSEGEGTSRRRVLTIESYGGAFSVGLFNAISLGVSVHSEKVRMAYVDELGALTEEFKESVYPAFGVLFHLDRKASLGITHVPERKYNFDESLDSRLTAGNYTREWFHDVVIPAKTTLGLSAQQNQRLSWVGDIDIIEPVKNGIYVGGSKSDPDHRIIETTQTIMHGGFEYFVQKSQDLDFIWRGGGYNEPKRVAYGADRLHFTMGIEIRYLFIVLAASYDQAPDFSNVVQSVGISLGAI